MIKEGPRLDQGGSEGTSRANKLGPGEELEETMKDPWEPERMKVRAGVDQRGSEGTRRGSRGDQKGPEGNHGKRSRIRENQEKTKGGPGVDQGDHREPGGQQGGTWRASG